MKNNKTLILSLIAGGIFAIPLIIYVLKFYNHSLSDNPSDWGTFGDYIGGITGALLAFTGILISYEFNSTALKKQEKSLRPLAFIVAGDYENRIYVGIKNSGLGPLLIKNCKVSDDKGNVLRNIIDFMPELPENYYWTNFFGNPIGYVIKEGTEVPLIEIEARNLSLAKTDFAGEEDVLSEEFFITAFASIRDKIRLSLSNLAVEIEYEDIYENKMPIFRRKLDWFARNIKDKLD
jgi:hypothetical protein